jgi:hypothetical protein
VNLTRLAPGAVSALHHRHSHQDEFIYVVEGEPTLFTDAGETQLRPGMVAGFAADGTAHHLKNHTGRDCVILEVGDRTKGDEVSYPTDDIQPVIGEDGKWQYPTRMVRYIDLPAGRRVDARATGDAASIRAHEATGARPCRNAVRDTA